MRCLLQRPTSSAEFREKLVAAGVELPADLSEPIVCHCGSGGRGGRAALLLEELGYVNVHNGGALVLCHVVPCCNDAFPAMEHMALNRWAVAHRPIAATIAVR